MLERRSYLTQISGPSHYPVGNQGVTIKKAMYHCELCGKDKLIACIYVRDLKTLSCGCYFNRVDRFRSQPRKHGLTEHPLFKIWSYIKTKLNNKNFKRAYEPVPLQASWNEFINFYNWAKDKWVKGLSINRRALEVGFIEENCYFCTRKELNVSNKRRKTIETNLVKYGVEHTFQSESVKEKSRQTCLERYGEEYAIQNLEILKKAQETHFLLYGTTHPVTNLTQQNQVKEWLESFGEIWPSDNSVIFPKEIDCYCSNREIGLEYSGIF